MCLESCRAHWGELALILHIFKVIQANADCQAQSQCLSEFCHLTLASSTYDNRMIRIRNPFVLEQCWTRLQLWMQDASLYICSAKWKRMFCNFITKPGRDFILNTGQLDIREATRQPTQLRKARPEKETELQPPFSSFRAATWPLPPGSIARVKIAAQCIHLGKSRGFFPRLENLEVAGLERTMIESQKGGQKKRKT